MKYEYYCEKIDVDELVEGTDNPTLEVMGKLGWELCVASQGVFIFKRALL